MTLFSNVPSAESVADADYVLGLQGSTGPGTGNTAKMTLQQIINLFGTFPPSFADITVTGTSASSVTSQGGSVWGANDFKKVSILPNGTGDSQCFNINRVTSAVTDTYVSGLSWVMTDTAQSASPRFGYSVGVTSNVGADPGEVWGSFFGFHTNAGNASGKNHVASYSQIVRDSIPAGGVGSNIEGHVIEAHSLTGHSSATDGTMRTLELDMFCAGADDYAGGVGREVMPIVLGKGQVSDAAPTVSSIIGVYGSSGYQTTVGKVLHTEGFLNISDSVVSSRGSTLNAGANAIWLGTNHPIALDTNAATKITSDGTTVAVTGNASIGGSLTLSGNPTTALQAATKGYADLMLPLAGGTMTGALTISAGGLSVSGGGTLSGVFSGGTFSTGGTFTGKQFQVSAPVTFSTSAGNAIFRYSGNISGTTTESPSTYFSGIQVANDTVVANNILIDLYQAKENLRAGATGSRTSLHGYMNVLGTPGDTGQFYLSVQGDTFASANAGGSSWSAPSGATRGAEFSSLLATGATFYVNNGALELSAGIQSGASAQFRSIIAIEADSTEATRGNFFDAGISFSKESAPSSPGLQYGIAFGHAGHQWYFASDSTLIAAVIRTQGIGGTNSQPLVAAVGTDYSKVKFGTASMLMPGMSVDPTGQIFTANASIARNTTGIKIDVPNLIVTGGTVGASGAGYNANDLVYEATSGSTFSVTVDGSGHITALTLVVPGNLASAPGGALALTGGNGTNATVNLTTAANKALTLNPSGDTIVGKSSAGATTDTTGFLMVPFVSGTPTGVPMNASSGIAMRYDTSANKLWVYNGAWKSASFA